MGDAQLVCLDSDDLLHPNTGEASYNESAYFNFYDPVQRTGGFVRLGNRPNEGHAEMTICLYRPDGGAAFMYGRPQIAGNTAFDAGGMRFEVVDAMRAHRVRYAGSVCMMANPLDLLDPRRAFRENPHRGCELDLAFTALSPAYGGELRVRDGERWVSVRHEKAGQEFARGHLEQHVRAQGRLVLDGTATRLDGCGLRDRSWGPRSWQAPLWYRWLTMSFGPDHGLAGALTHQRDGSELQGGYIYEKGQPNRPIARVEVESEHGAEQLHTALRVRLHPADGGAAIAVSGRVLAMVPLRHRRGEVTTRIAEGLTEWRWGDRVGYGWSEFLDHPD